MKNINLLGSGIEQSLENFNLNHYQKMVKLCKDSLVKKCLKVSINPALGDFTEGIYEQFCDIDKSADRLMSTYQSDKNKETSAKYKKDIKGLVNQKSKYISDLMKNLAYIGLSYRRGNLQYASEQDEPKKVISFKPCVLTAFSKTFNHQKHRQLFEVFNQTDFNYYLCVDRFFAFKDLMNNKTRVASKDVNTLPVEKFRGFVEHLFHVIHVQKQQVHMLVNQVECLGLLSETCGLVSQAVVSDPNCWVKFVATREYCERAYDLIKQIELFFGSLGEDNGEVTVGYEAIKVIEFLFL